MDHCLYISSACSEDEEAYHGTKGDQTDQCVWGQQAQADNQSLSQSLELVLVDTSVDHVKEYRGDLGGSRKGVFDSSVFRQQLGGEVGSRDILIVRWERVPLQTERTDPEFAPNVDLTVSSALLGTNRE